jgi:hypothetical protein
MTASIFFIAPKLELTHQMASNPIQMGDSDSLSSLDNGFCCECSAEDKKARSSLRRRICSA